jgi:hypothetical protein
MWVREACERTLGQVQALQLALLAKAEAHADAVMPGFTHLQPAQPVTFGHHLMAYVEMFGRDASRFHDARARMNENPLGAAALAGSPFPIDRHATAKALGFDRPTANSLDSVSARDFALEALSACAIAATFSDCPKILNMAPDSKEAEIFKQYGIEHEGKNATGAATPAASGAATGTYCKPHSDRRSSNDHRFIHGYETLC